MFDAFTIWRQPYRKFSWSCSGVYSSTDTQVSSFQIHSQTLSLHLWNSSTTWNGRRECQGKWRNWWALSWLDSCVVSSLSELRVSAFHVHLLHIVPSFEMATVLSSALKVRRVHDLVTINSTWRETHQEAKPHYSVCLLFTACSWICLPGLPMAELSFRGCKAWGTSLRNI